MKPIIIANITWNPEGWRNIYVNRHAGHRYVREAPGHESLNFKFDKAIDKNGKVHGYVQWTNPPRKYLSDGLVIFYSRNLKTNRGEIVGVYGGAKIIRPPLKTSYIGFENDLLLANIVAEEKLSMLFPIPLHEKKYKKILKTNRLVPQVGFRLIDDVGLAKSIIVDEILALRRVGMRQDEIEKLAMIYEYITGEQYVLDTNMDDDAKEQDEIIVILREQSENAKKNIVQDLKNLNPADPEIVAFKGKTYKRDNKTIAELKLLRDFKCQICGKQIIKKNGDYYIEAAHVIPKCKKGLETPENILILCPNHHKEFDVSDKNIINHDKKVIRFRLNSVEYVVDLSI